MAACWKLFALCAVLLAVAQCQVKNCEPGSCGSKGRCARKRAGDRCDCDAGWMGPRCDRPCQDIYKSCGRWLDEGRCDWDRRLGTNWFDDHCSASCETCRAKEDSPFVLETPVPYLLDSLTWLAGKWHARSDTGKHYPVDMRSAYEEDMDIKISPVSMFDRPSLNISTRAVATGGRDDVMEELGFALSKMFDEDTGFIDKNKPETGPDQVALQLSSNTGVNTIEEAVLDYHKFTLNTTFVASLPHTSHLEPSVGTMREFELLTNGMLRVTVVETDRNGNEADRYTNYYNREVDYMAIKYL